MWRTFVGVDYPNVYKTDQKPRSYWKSFILVIWTEWVLLYIIYRSTFKMVIHSTNFIVSRSVTESHIQILFHSLDRDKRDLKEPKSWLYGSGVLRGVRNLLILSTSRIEYLFLSLQINRIWDPWHNYLHHYVRGSTQ